MSQWLNFRILSNLPMQVNAMKEEDFSRLVRKGGAETRMCFVCSIHNSLDTATENFSKIDPFTFFHWS